MLLYLKYMQIFLRYKLYLRIQFIRTPRIVFTSNLTSDNNKMERISSCKRLIIEMWVVNLLDAVIAIS